MKMVWVDIETTGLDFDKDVLLEVAVVITQGFEEEAGTAVQIAQEESVLVGMNDWCQQQHTKSGLIEDVRKRGVDLAVAETHILSFLRENAEPSGFYPMCGNTIGFDRRMLSIHMPRLEGYFHYRNIDVSTVKELTKGWYPNIYNDINTLRIHEEKSHRALDDIRASINELKIYREKVFRDC